MKVAVGSTNPVKLEAVKMAFKAVWPDKKFEFEAIAVESGVPDQPMSSVEAIKGARTRAKNVLKKLKADFGVGLEGGAQQIGKDWFDCGWIVVVDKEGREGIGSSILMLVPKKMMKLIKKGVELGTADDILFGRKNSKQANGFFGIMTNDAITRSTGYRDGVISALACFVQPQVF